MTVNDNRPEENKQSNKTRNILIVVGAGVALCCCVLFLVFVLPVLLVLPIGDVFEQISGTLEAN